VKAVKPQRFGIDGDVMNDDARAWALLAPGFLELRHGRRKKKQKRAPSPTEYDAGWWEWYEKVLSPDVYARLVGYRKVGESDEF